MNHTELQETFPNTAAKPVYTRLPRKGEREYWSTQSRSAINLLILPSEENDYRPPVHSISLKRKGCSRGTRLILLETDPNDPKRKGLLDYLREQAQDAEEGEVSE